MKKYFLLLLLPFFLWGCEKTQPAEESTPPVTAAESEVVADGHTAETSLDWAGIYEGISSCEDCKIFSTRLTLNYEYTFVLEEFAKEGDMLGPKTRYEGTFDFVKGKPSLIKLGIENDPRVFFIGEGFAQAGDIETGQPLETDQAYQLEQIQTFVP